jgi:hypothetical protein
MLKRSNLSLQNHFQFKQLILRHLHFQIKHFLGIHLNLGNIKLKFSFQVNRFPQDSLMLLNHFQNHLQSKIRYSNLSQTLFKIRFKAIHFVFKSLSFHQLIRNLHRCFQKLFHLDQLHFLKSNIKPHHQRWQKINLKVGHLHSHFLQFHFNYYLQ